MNTNITKIFEGWWATLALGIGIIVLAIFLRTYNINSLPVFADEAIYVRWAQVMKAEPTLRFIPVSDGKQPLYMWTVMPFLKFISDPFVAGRTVSALTGIGSLIGLFTLTFLIFKNKRVSLLAALFYALSPYSVFFDRMALVDSILTMFGIWTFVFAVVTVKHVRLDTAMITGFTLGAALLTKSSALFYVILLPTPLLLAKFPKEKTKRSVFLLKQAALWGVTLAIAYGMYNILRLGPNFHIITSRNQDYVFPITHFLDSPLDPFLPFVDRSIEWMRMLGPSAVLLFATLAFLGNIKKHYKEILLVSVWFIAPIFIQSEFAKVFTARYIYFSIPYVFILASTVLIFVTAKRGRRVIRNLVYLAIGVFVLHSLSINNLLINNPEAAPLPRSERSGYLEEWTAGTGIKEAADYIRKYHLANPDEKIVVGTEGFFGTLPDGLQVYLNDLPEITVIGVGLDFTKIPSSLIESKKFGNKTYLLVNSSRIKFEESEFSNKGLEVVSSWKKADRPDGFREYVQHGPYDTLYLFEVVAIVEDL